MNGRLAGLLYLCIIVCGVFAEMFVRSRLMEAGDATATAENIAASPLLFRLGFVSDLIMVSCDVALAAVFYLLLRPVHAGLSLLAALFRLAQAAILGVNLLNHFAVILLLSGASYLQPFEPGQLHALSLFFLESHKHGYLISGVFFGFHCVLLGALFARSQLVPRILGFGLMAAGAGYLIESFTLFVFPGAAPITYPGLAIAGIVELALCAWLLVRGVRRPAAAEL